MQNNFDYNVRSPQKEQKNMSELIHRADTYIAQRASMVDARFRHTYHAMPPVGWMNDPNGFCYAFGRYHVFFQFHPYDSVWGPMHWGHYASDDLIRWEWQGTALAPDTAYDADGCFSGSAIVKDGALYLMYTAVAGGKQTQALARSFDGVHFEKLGQVIAAPPDDCSAADFRDPYLFEREGTFYCLVGSKHCDGDGTVLLYRSEDLFGWDFVGKTWKDGRTKNGIYECPAFAALDGTDALFLSPQFMECDGIQHENIFSNLYMLGSLDLRSGIFLKESEAEIDGGSDFYAAQTLGLSDGRTVMTAWMQMWDRGFPTAAHGWAGALILPRELTVKNGKLYQAPVREIEKYRTNSYRYAEAIIDGELRLNGIEGDKIELSFELEPKTCARAGVKLYCGDGCETKISYDVAEKIAYIDRSRMGTFIKAASGEKDAVLRRTHIGMKNGRLHFRIFLDVSSCEVFLGGGEKTLTGNVYSPGKGIVFFSEGGTAHLFNVEKYDIAVSER